MKAGLIFPIIMMIFGITFIDDIKSFTNPDFEITILESEASEILNAGSVGNRKFELFTKNVDAAYITKVQFKNTGSKAIKKLEALMSVKHDVPLDLYKVFYTTVPREQFKGVKFNKRENSRLLNLDVFIEKNAIEVTFISSAPISIETIVNMSGVSVKRDTADDITDNVLFVSVFSALLVLFARFLIDIVSFVWKWVTKKKST